MEHHTVICEDCGFRYDGAQKLCPMCGSRHRTAVGGECAPQPEKKKNPKVLGGIVIITAMVLMTFWSASLLQRTAPQPPAPEPEPVVPVEPAVPVEPVVPAKPVPVKPEPQMMDEKQLRQACQAVVDDYSARIREATPRLMEEFKAETEGESDGRVLAHVCNKKIGVLAELCNEGLREIWDLLYANKLDPSHPDYEDYTDYEFRLNLAYEDAAMEVSNLYSEYFILHAS